MIKRSILAMILVVVLLLAVSVVVVSAQTPTAAPATTSSDVTLKRLIVRNQSDNFLSIVLTSEDGNRTYVLWTPAGEERIFTVPEGMYNRTTYACNASNSGSLDLSRQTRLVFNSCFGDPPNWGEPSLEKITVEGDGPGNPEFQYGYE